MGGLQQTLLSSSITHSRNPYGRRYALLVAVIGLACIGSVLFLNQATQPLALSIANAHQGQHWYRIQIGDQHVGYMHNHSHRDWQGNLHFETTTHFLSEDNVPSTITKHLTFRGSAPFRLQRAAYRETSATQQQATLIRHLDEENVSPYLAVLSRNGETSSVALDWQFTLSDFFAFEAWLATTQPEQGASQLVKSLDFERLRITQRSYSVVDRNEAGYLVETPAPFAPTQTQLDKNFVPQNLTMAGVFNIRLSTEADAIALKNLRNKTDYLFPLDQRLSSQQTVQQLKLSLQPKVSGGFPAQFESRVGQATTQGNPSNFVGEALRYPITHADVQALVLRARHAASSGGDLVSHLVQQVKRQIRYEEDNPAGSVLSALARGTGECTDFADLLTTLARAAGLPARTMYGIAYKDGPQPAMMFHAWNEIYFQQRWQVVDPTWGQRVADATHIALSDSEAAVLMLTHVTQPLSFAVLHVEYTQLTPLDNPAYAN